MSCSLPAEILDLIIDKLRDESITLKECCLVSKSWIPRARSHLFANLRFNLNLLPHAAELWMMTFPDPPNSPAHHTRGLTIFSLPAITTTGASVASWIRTFHNVVRLHFEDTAWADHQAPFTPFYGFSHTVRSLRLTSTSFEVFDLVCSFPLLEDLALVSLLPEGGGAGWTAPPTSPKLTGSLELSSAAEIRPAIRRLLDFRGGLRFAKITVLFPGRDFGAETDLVSGCSGTLESLTISSSVLGTSMAPFPDLSKAQKLEDITFLCTRLGIHWVVAALRTVESKNLRQITIHPHFRVNRSLTSTSAQWEWDNLDQLLVQFWTSHSIRPRFAYSPDSGGKNLKDWTPSLLPELTLRGLVDLVEYYPLS